MRNAVLYFVTISLFFSMMPPTVSSEDKPGLTLGIEIFTAYTYWENEYTKEKFDNLGPGLFITPKLKKQFGQVFFTIDVTLSRFHFMGPAGLTITGPDYDIDSGFRSRMNRRDILFRAGYKFLKLFALSLDLKYNFLKLDGDHKVPGLRYEYLEKGFLFGPALNAKQPIGKSTLFFDVSYLAGHLNTEYLNTYIPIPRAGISENQINSRLFIGGLGILIPLGKTLDLSFFYKFGYEVKNAKSSIYEFYYNPTDLWFQGLATGVTYDL